MINNKENKINKMMNKMDKNKMMKEVKFQVHNL